MSEKPSSNKGHVRKQIAAVQSIEQFYRAHRIDFLNFGKSYGLTSEDILDAFQDAVIIFYEQKSAGKLEALNCTEKTYLFSIGKHKLVDRVREKSKARTVAPGFETIPIDPEILQKMELSDKQQLLKACLAELGEKCQELLLLFYYQRFSIDAIRQKMDYKSDNVVKAHKSRCMKKLKEIFTAKNRN